ncbi:MAG: flagellar filament capping protein FliD [bacterium]|nr:flagellar filament capping protein FliD [bacterium]
MAAISSIGSGANSIETLIQQTIASERGPITDLEDNKKTLQMRLNIFNDLKTKLKGLRSVAQDFTKIDTLNTLLSKTATSSNENFFTVSAGSDADIGTHTLAINRLASSDTGLSKQLDREGTSLATKSLGLQEFSIKVGDEDAVNFSVTVDAADTDLQVMEKVRDAINDGGVDANASIIYDTNSTARLIIKSEKTGSENQLEMTELNGSNILRKLKYLTNGGSRRLADGTTGGFLIQDIAELDASFNIDGIDIVTSENEVSYILPGLSLNLLQAQGPDDTPLTFKVEQDTTKTKDEIKNFMDKYNGVITYLNAKTAVDTTTYTRGVFAGDFVISNLKFSMRSLVTTPIAAEPDAEIQFLSQIGISFDREGLMSIKDSSKLDDMMESNIDELTALFTSDDGIGARLEELLDRFVDSGGTVDRSREGVTRQLKSIDTRIDNYEARLAVRAESLRREYTQLQKTLSLLNNQQYMIQNSMAVLGQYT